MTDATTHADPIADAAEVLADARETLAELIEEGVDAWETAAPLEPRTEPEPTPSAPTPAPSSAAMPAAAASGSARRARPAPTAPAAERPALALSAEPAADAEISFGDAPTLEQVREALGDCRRCGLCEGRKTIVFGDGNPDADILFVGEGPGQQEDERGLPFVGRAGELLTQMIEKGIEIPRNSVYICNIVKCRPPKNRTPLPPEVSACRPFLDGQIDAVKPRVIVALGKPATSLLLGRDVAITRVRGTWHEYRGIPLMPTLHPAYVLRQYTPENRRSVWEDLKAALARSRE
jgi:DNA polymerase